MGSEASGGEPGGSSLVAGELAELTATANDARWDGSEVGATRELETLRPAGLASSRPSGRGAARRVGPDRDPAPSSARGSEGVVMDDALHAEEVHRVRGWSVCVIILTLSASAFMFFLPVTPAARAAFVATTTAMFLISVWVLRRTRDERRYTPGVFRFFGWSAATASFVVLYVIGVFSPTPLVVTLGITFFGLGMDRRGALLIPIYASVGYFVLSSLITLGVIEDRGLVSSESMTMTTKVFATLMVPLALGITLWMARVSRRSMIGAVRRAHAAMRLAGQREAQLAEANQNLEHMLHAGAGQEGRRTGALAGSYRLAEVVGRGAMGEVYAAEHLTTGERVAVKLLRPDVAVKRGALARFLREGELVSALEVPNVVQVRDIGALEDGAPYIAMELLTGEDLASLLRREGQLEPERLLDMLRQVARGLDAAHQAGIIHRDLKPQNLFWAHAPGGERLWKVLDFGVSKVAGSGGTLTQRAVVGTPGYMAPEQARGDEVTARADVFSLAAVVYRALTGRPPFSGAETPQIMYQVVYGMPPRPSELRPALPREVDAALAVGLAKDPAERFARASELAAALAAAFERRLDPGVARRAAALLAALPWSSAQRAAS